MQIVFQYRGSCKRYCKTGIKNPRNLKKLQAVYCHMSKILLRPDSMLQRKHLYYTFDNGTYDLTFAFIYVGLYSLLFILKFVLL